MTMTRCWRRWCENDTKILCGGVVAHVWHRRTVARVPLGEHELIISLFAVDDGDPFVRLRSKRTQDEDTASEPVLSMTTSAASQLTAGLLDAVDKTRTAADSVGDDGASWDLDLLTQVLRERAEQERAAHGPDLRMGPFDEDLPLGLMALVSNDFTVPGKPQLAVDWLLGMLKNQRIDTGRVDEEIAQEIVELLGTDAAQVVGGWLYRATFRQQPSKTRLSDG